MSYFPKLTAVVNVSATQIKSLHTSPVLLVPGVSGCIVDIKSLILVYHAGAQAFNPGGEDQLAAITGALPNSFLATGFSASGFCDQSSDQINWVENWWDPGDGNGNNLPLADIIGSGISLFQYNVNDVWPGGANWTLGNGTFTAYIEYTCIVA